MLLLLKGSVDNSEYTAFEESPNELPQCDVRAYSSAANLLEWLYCKSGFHKPNKPNKNIATAVFLSTASES